MINIAIVDDNLPDVVKLESYIQNWNLSNVSSYNNGSEFLREFEPGKFHVVFMDIIMDGLSGIQTARQIRSEDSQILIVFITTSREYAFDAFSVHPFEYIIKPFNENSVAKVLDEAARFFASPDPSVAIKIPHCEYNIPIRLIISAVSSNHSVEINLSNGKNLLSNMRFAQIEKMLVQFPNFLACNRGVIVNMSQISALDKDVFVMKNGERFPIRVNGRAKIISRFSQFLIANMRGSVTNNASEIRA